MKVINHIGLSLVIALILWLPATSQKKCPDLSVIRAVPALYPKVAAATGAQGDVVVEAKVDSYGRVLSARTIKGIPLLGAAAENSVRLWNFSSVEKDRERTVQLLFTFILLPENTSTRELLPVFIPPYHIEVRGSALKVKDTPNVDPALPKRPGV